MPTPRLPPSFRSPSGPARRPTGVARSLASALALAVLAFAVAPAAAADATREPWRATLAARLGAAFGAGEIGRDTNATGGEPLIARLPDGPVLALRGNAERSFFAVGVEIASLARPIEVENEAGVDFPHHGTRPLLYSLEVELYPAGRGLLAGRLRPYAGIGAGGAALSVDLDNRRQQELTHHWLSKASGGLRWRRRADAELFLELRYEITRVRASAPLADFTLRQATVAYGLDL
jgi:hypothetical protein